MTKYQVLTSHGVKFSARLLSRLLDLCGEQHLSSSFSPPLGTPVPVLAQQLFSELKVHCVGLDNYLALMRTLAKLNMSSQ